MADNTPHPIEAQSMAIIEGLLPDIAWSPEEREVVKRLVHTSGDPSLAESVRFHPSAIAAGLAALQRGAKVYTDVHMVEAGINRGRLRALHSGTICAIDDPYVISEANTTGQTRAWSAMQMFGEALDGAIVAIGNAPTALRAVLALAAEGIARPALVIGMPVGFVDAAESKDALMASDLVFISIAGTRGGSPLAATTINALLRLL